MSNTQLSFALRTTSNVKTVHLIGSWDGYQGQLPLSRDGSRSGSWKGTFKFQPNVLQSGQRYWFYYMMDGHKVSHDPTKEAVVEPTTGRTLNVLDVPKSKSSSSRHQSTACASTAAAASAAPPRTRTTATCRTAAAPRSSRPSAADTSATRAASRDTTARRGATAWSWGESAFHLDIFFLHSANCVRSTSIKLYQTLIFNRHCARNKQMLP